MGTGWEKTKRMTTDVLVTENMPGYVAILTSQDVFFPPVPIHIPFLEYKYEYSNHFSCLLKIASIIVSDTSITLLVPGTLKIEIGEELSSMEEKWIMF